MSAAARKRIYVVLGLLAAAVAVWGGWPWIAKAWAAANKKQPDTASSIDHDETTNPGVPKSITLKNVETAEAVRPTRPRTLDLRGWLSLDVNRLVHAHARFPGQVVEITTIEEPANGYSGVPNHTRALRSGDRVVKGQRLAVIWSRELGEKKSELVSSLARLHLDEVTLVKLQELNKKGAATERAVREQERAVEVGEIDVIRAERTLRSWGLTDEEVDSIKTEADEIHRGRKDRKREEEKDWARVDVLAPADGTIVEKNVAVGNIIDTGDDLFKIADLTWMSVWAHMYEEDLPLLEGVPRPIRWTIRLNSNPDGPPIVGLADRIGDIINPNDHMALVVGSVENSRGELRVGQFVTATISLPPEADTVEIPSRALVEDGVESVAFVRDSSGDGPAHEYTLRRLSVVRRYHDVIFVRSKLTPEQKRAGLEELHPGERVISAKALELKAALEEGAKKSK